MKIQSLSRLHQTWLPASESCSNRWALHNPLLQDHVSFQRTLYHSPAPPIYCPSLADDLPEAREYITVERIWDSCCSVCIFINDRTGGCCRAGVVGRSMSSRVGSVAKYF